MSERTDIPPLPCGEGAGGEGREGPSLSVESKRALNVEAPDVDQRRSTPTPSSQGRRGRKLGHGYAPLFGNDRQKDHVRTKLRAARMRKEMTPSEKAFWKLVRTVEGETFRRQVAIGDYVFDFGHYKRRLLIEIDGAVHEFEDVKANDKAKELFAVLQGFRVLRFRNEDVRDRPAWVIDQLRAGLSAPHPPAPSPQGRGGEFE